MRSLRHPYIAGIVLAASLATPSWAQEAAPAPAPAPPPAARGAGEAEEIVVTGSYIKGTPENAALNVDVTSLEDLKSVGAPTIQEMVRNLSYTSGNISETNQFQVGGQGNIGVSTINLRGLGSARTLVLFNGRRHVPDDTWGVDVTAIPKSVIGRVEALKDGAAALYGSDAIGGVANFITRSDFEGIEISGAEQFIKGSNGDHNVSVLTGWSNDRLHIISALEWAHRSVLTVPDRNWALRPWNENLEGGWTAIGNPATIFALPTFAQAADPYCAALGGALTGAAPTSTVLNTCRFQYTYFDNLTDKQDTVNAYGEANFDLTDETRFHFEYLYSNNDSDYKTSPSFAPQSNTGPDRSIRLVTGPNGEPPHPGFVAMNAAYPGLFPAGTTGAFVINRSLGVVGCQGQINCRETGEGETFATETVQTRVALGVTGKIFDSLDYDLSFAYSSRDRSQNAADMFVERMAFALDGLGGPNCDQSTGTAGAGGCLYYNPFSNALPGSVVNGATNPGYDPAVANDPDLLKWLYGPQEFAQRNELKVWDGVVSGVLPWELGAGEIGWAAGVQVRLEEYDFDVSAPTNLALTPCPFTNPRSLPFNALTNPLGLGNITQTAWDACLAGTAGATGPYAFLANFTEEHTKRTVYAFFGELNIPIFKMLEAQLALRYENFGGDVGSTVDPKLSLRFQPLDWLTLRGSVSTTFRAPPQSFLGGRATGLEFVIPAGSFKAVDTFGNPNLDPETALATNVGVILEWAGLYASLDYWRFDFQDPFQTESQGQLVSRYGNFNATTNPFGADCADGQIGAATPECAPIRAHIFTTPLPGGSTNGPASTIQRVEVNFINGADILTSGLDFYVQYEFEDLFGGVLAVGGTGTYTFEYTSDDFVDIGGALIRPGGDFNGFLNKNTAPFTPKPDLKAETFVKYTHGIHNGTILGRYTTGYTDAIPSLPNLAKVDSHFVVDTHYNVALFEESTVLSFSVMNLTDEKPPQASMNLNYDPFTHDSRGRMYKVGLTYTWQPQ